MKIKSESGEGHRQASSVSVGARRGYGDGAGCILSRPSCPVRNQLEITTCLFAVGGQLALQCKYFIPDSRQGAFKDVCWTMLSSCRPLKVTGLMF